MSQPPAKPRLFQSRLRSLLIAVVFVAVFLATNGFGLVGLHYPHAIENDPLIAPVRVVSVQNDTLELEDGRVIVVDAISDPLDELIKASDDHVDIEFEDGSTNVVVFAKTRSWICGTSWIRLVNIPLIPDDVPINRRETICFGRLVTNQDTVAVQGRR
ncbi:MAG: hypothetical protein H8E66_05490 [Planctomycetes bacterium]|nr:hypothetical protein [Planctomycetota bacterium]